MKKPYPVYRKDILTGKILSRSGLFRIVKQGKCAISANRGESGKGIYLDPSALISEESLKKKLIRLVPGTDFSMLYKEIQEWKQNRKQTA